jgi:hypothetical protein
MSDSFVDLGYRGLALGRRIKLTQVRSSTGYLELSTPMPVGTTITVTTDDGLSLEARVTDVHEQVGGSDRPPGMMIEPRLDGDALRAWWQQRVEELERPPPPADPDGRVTVTSRRRTAAVAVSELVDDGRSTAVMEAIAVPDGVVDTVIADVPVDSGVAAPIVDDGKRTVAMAAVDLAALGLTSPSAEMAAVAPPDEDGAAPASGDKPDGRDGKAKKKRKRR